MTTKDRRTVITKSKKRKSKRAAAVQEIIEKMNGDVEISVAIGNEFQTILPDEQDEKPTRDKAIRVSEREIEKELGLIVSRTCTKQ